MKVLKTTLLSLIATIALVATTTVSAKKPSERTTLVDLAVEVSAATGDFNALIQAVVANELVLSTLDGNGQFTVFAPTDAAFNDLTAAAAANCITLTPELVQSVLLYHVSKGRRDSGEVLATEQFRTLLGAFFAHDNLVITDNAGQAANIVGPDNFADNGVIHVIDTVLLPFPIANQC